MTLFFSRKRRENFPFLSCFDIASLFVEAVEKPFYTDEKLIINLCKREKKRVMEKLETVFMMKEEDVLSYQICCSQVS